MYQRDIPRLPVVSRSPVCLAIALAVLRPTQDGFENVTKQAKAGEPLPQGKYMAASVRWAAK
jgi:hypothetical protein